MAFDDDDDDRDDRPPRRRRHYDEDEGEYDFGKRDLPHSGLGIASLVLAVLGGVFLLGVVVVAGVMAGDDMGGFDEESPAGIALGLVAIFACALALLGLGLGIGALVQKDRNKVFGVIGVAASGAVLFGAAILACVGAVMS